MTEALVAPDDSPVEAARKLAEKGVRLFIARPAGGETHPAGRRAEAAGRAGVQRLGAATIVCAARLPGQSVPYRAEPRDAHRRAGAISPVRRWQQGFAGSRPQRRRHRLCRRFSRLGEKIRAKDRRGKTLDLRAAGPGPRRQRHRGGGADFRARRDTTSLSWPTRPAISATISFTAPPSRRLVAGTQGLVSTSWHSPTPPVAPSNCRTVFSRWPKRRMRPDRLPGLDGGAGDRRRGAELRGADPRISRETREAGLQPGHIQGRGGDFSALGPAVAAGHSAGAAEIACRARAAAGFSAPAQHVGHARRGSRPKAPVKSRRRHEGAPRHDVAALCLRAHAPAGPTAHLCHQRKMQRHHRDRQRHAGRDARPSRRAAGRAACWSAPTANCSMSAPATRTASRFSTPPR